MLEHLPEMIRSGVHSMKIEGRMKGIHYVATAVKVYREALDAFFENPDGFEVQQEWRDLLAGIGQRRYCTGFYFGHPDETVPNDAFLGNREPPRLVGKEEDAPSDGWLTVDVRNTFCVGDPVEVFSPGHPVRRAPVLGMQDSDGTVLSRARSGTRVMIELPIAAGRLDLIRKPSAPGTFEVP